jgi:phosphatidate cytidylyltransferase
MSYPFLTHIASWLGVTANVVFVSGFIAGGLAIGSVIRWMALRHSTPDERRKQLGSLAVWWVMLAIVALAALAGPVGGALAFGVVSLVGVREYFQLLDRKTVEQRGRGIVGIGVLATYLAIALIGDPTSATLVLVATIMGVTVRLVSAGITDGYLSAAGNLVWGSVVLVFFVSHAAMLLCLSPANNPAGGSAGWFIWLITVTECVDIFQALWGRRLGRHRITPLVSPGKTWEGFVLGGLTAVVIGVALAPFLTPMAEPWTLEFGGSSVRIPSVGALAAGVLLCIAGFFGDLNMSALKRDVGVKDSGTWLPGQGGILDRIDSLTFTAPAFYYFVRWFYD